MTLISDLREIVSDVEKEFEKPSSSEILDIVGALLHTLEESKVLGGADPASSPPAASEEGEGGDAPTAQPSPSSSTWGGQ